MIAKTRGNLGPLALFFLVCTLTGCERSTHVKIEGETAPVFVLSGSGNLAIFVVYGPDYVTKAENPSDENYTVWKIKPMGGYFAGTPVEDLEKITYGVVPLGYEQLKPQTGTPPPPLVEGQKYSYFVETTNAAGAGGYLEIRNSRAVPTIGLGPCFGRNDGKWIRVPCPP